MNSSKRGYTKSAAILIIVFACINMAISLIVGMIGGFITEDIVKETYKTDTAYTYFENEDGSYFFEGLEDGIVVRISESDIELSAKIMRGAMIGLGVISFGYFTAKLILAILILKGVNKNVFKKGLVISSLVLSALSMSILEIVFLILALCTKNTPPVTYESLGDITPEN